MYILVHTNKNPSEYFKIGQFKSISFRFLSERNIFCLIEKVASHFCVTSSQGFRLFSSHIKSALFNSKIKLF